MQDTAPRAIRGAFHVRVEATTNLVSGVWTNDGYTVSGSNVTGVTLEEVANTVDTVADERFIRLKIFTEHSGRGVRTVLRKMKKARSIGMIGKLCRVVLGTLLMGITVAQASISTYSADGGGYASQLFGFVYNGDGTNITTSGFASIDSGGALTDAKAGDTFSWTITGATGWDTASAQANESDFNAYVAGFTYGQTVGHDADDIGGVNNSKLNFGEVMIFDFDVSGLHANSCLKLLSTSTGNATADGSSAGDWVLVDKVANTVVDSAYGVTKGVLDFSGVEIQNSNYRLYYAGNNDGLTGSFRVTRLVVDVLQTAATVPDVLGLDQAAAESAIVNAGLVVGTVTESYSETVAAGLVVSQDPANGGSVDYDTPVGLVISLGPFPLLVQHLDAALTGSVFAASGVVTQWVDQSTSGNDAVSSAGSVLYPGAIIPKTGTAGLDTQSGRNSLELFSAAGSDSWLDQSGGTNGFCVLVALQCKSVRSGGNDVIGNSPDGSSGFGMGFDGAGDVQAWLGGQSIASAGSKNLAGGDTLVLALNYDAATESYEFWDSKNLASATGSLAKADFSLGAPVTLGSAASSTRYLDGQVAEVKVFGSRLSASHFAQQRIQMLNKWQPQPNLVLIYVDDWAWNASSVAMDSRMRNSHMPDIIEMPNLDSIAEHGMVFRNAYGSPQCTPARAAIQTGQSNPRNGITVFLSQSTYYVNDGSDGFPVISNGSDRPLRTNSVTIAEALAPLGYQSGFFGKWHIRDTDPNDRGFYAPDGETSNTEGNTYVGDGNSMEGIVDPKLMKHVTDSGIAFIEEKVAEGVPFYVQFSHYAMHAGYECFPEDRARYQNHPAVVAYNGGETNPANLGRNDDPAVYLAMAYELDQKIGEVRQKLVDLGIADNTYLVVAGDNGYREGFYDGLFGLSQPLHSAKWWLWQGGIRVPMLAEGPGIATNAECTANVVNYDFLPTFYTWAGGDTNELQDIDGISLAGLMEGETPSESFRNRSLYFHYPHYRTSMPFSVMVKGHEKVVYFYETPVRFPAWEPIMYFDIGSDVGEYHNIYPQNPARAEELYADMTNYLAMVGARIPLVPNPLYDEAAYANAAGYADRVMWGPFIGTRATESDEFGPTTFLGYWMDSWGVDIGAETNDYDGDGIANWVEYAQGSDPTDPASVGTDPVLDSDGGLLAYRYAKRNDDSSLMYSVQATTNLLTGPWTNVADGAEVISTYGAMDETEISLMPDQPQAFIRMNISKP